MGGEDMAAEGFTRITWEIEELQPGFCKVTAIHDLEGAPQLAALVSGEMETEGAGGGWPEVLSGLKTVLETGESLRATEDSAVGRRTGAAPRGARPRLLTLAGCSGSVGRGCPGRTGA